MELLYLLGSIIWNSIISFALSLLLPFRLLIRRAFPSDDDGIILYEGVVWHERRRPVHHSFKYNVRYALIHLDVSPLSPSSNHLSADEARNITGTTGPVFLLTIPPSVGYEQNPLSLYYCYDQENSSTSLKKCIAEVTNTPWGERVSFVFNPSSDVVAKALHVSPFMDMQGSWKIKATAPRNDLSVVISVHHPDLGEHFCAILRAQRVSSSKVDQLFFFWLMPHKVAVWIYWHALKLWWKSVSFVQHPRYNNPAYREEAVSRDKKLNCCKAGDFETSLCPREDRNVIDHQFSWTDAKWPWS
ncbi:uncharacterized protein LOC110728544 [Chenopodium quinoa]|uniref:uncharacterized protein LOC110728544 n=1 Tax=Chenopodium quinoa TaxID=63459 RepID=UPI000B77305B|nr:uncharacterized protein LOC110728544 [Chenopodium quinoa]